MASKDDPTTVRTMPGVPYHHAQAIRAMERAPELANALAADYALAQVHAQLAVADAVERQTAAIRALTSMLDPSRGEP